MIWWDKCRSFLLRADQSFHLWADRLPEWKLALLMPYLVLVLMVEWACYLRRTTAVVAVTLVAIYVPLIRSGDVAFSWGGALRGLGIGCLTVIGMLYFSVGLMVLGLLEMRLLNALWPWREGKESPERTGAPFSLWDREIDG